MIADLLRAPVVHFGAGSLGRGLIVPVLVANGAAVTVVDTDAALVGRLAGDRAYGLQTGARQQQIRIAGALAAGDARLPGLLADARLVTTSVRAPNLRSVAASLAQGWQHDPATDRVVVGCENMHNVGAEITRLLVAEGADMARITAPDCVVDRVCAARWPLDLAVETEDYLEWSVAGGALAGIQLAETVDTIGPRFSRKRYLVNTYADAMAFLGLRAGYGMLHETASDAALLERIEPLMTALRRLLHRRDGFDAAGLWQYQNMARARLANAAIGRRLSTVARDLERKMLPDERFIEPIATLIGYGDDVDAAVDVVAAILDDPAADRAKTLAAMREAWRGHDWADFVLARVAESWGVLAPGSG